MTTVLAIGSGDHRDGATIGNKTRRAGGRQSVSCDFWAAAQADGVMESGICWPFGKPVPQVSKIRGRA